MMINVSRKYRTFFVMAVWVGLVMGTGLAGQKTAAAQIMEKEGVYRLSNQNLEMALDKKSSEVTGIKSLSPEIILPAISGRILVTDAGSGKPMLFSPAGGWKKKNNCLSFSSLDTTANLGLLQEITVFPGHMEWQAELENRTDARAEFTVALNVSFPAPAGWTYWDGGYIHDNPLSSFETAPLFPMACIYTNQGGLSLGLEPRQLLPLTSGIRKEKDSGWAFSHAAKILLLPRQKVPVTFLLYAFNPDYGFRSAMQRYYDIYPEVFVPRPDIDPRLKNAGGAAVFLYGFADFGNEDAKQLALENSRRFYATWDWGYPTGHTYTRRGDYYGHAEKWPAWYADREAQLKRKAEVFTTVGRDEMAMSHYIWLPGAEGSLLEQFYPDAIVRDKNGQPVCGYTETIAGRLERNYSVNFFVDGRPNKFALDTMADLKLLTKELDLTAFSFDTCGGIDQARFADYVHTLVNGRYHVGVIANAGDRFTVPRTDVLILEHVPYGNEDDYQWPMRYLAGHKMAIFWWPYMITQAVDDLRAMSSEEIKETYLRLRDYTILSCLQKGHFPHFACADGLPTMFRYFPVFLEIFHAGWEPVFAMKLQSADDSIWLSRYGRDTGAFLVAGNSTREEKTVSVRIENRYLGEESYLVSTYQGTPVPQIIKGKDTLLTLKIPGGSPVILKSWIGIQPRGEIAASVRTDAGVDRSGLTADLECSQSFATPFFLRLPEDAAIAKITLNGKSQSFRQEKGTWFFRGKLEKGKNHIEVEYTSRIFADNEARLLDFPFVKEGIPVCKLVLSNPQDDNQKYVASLLQGYFRFYYQKKENKKVFMPVTGLSDAAGTDTKMVIEIKPGVKSGVKREGNTLYLRAETGDQAKDIVRKFMRVLDRKYVWLPVLGDNYNFEPEYWHAVMKKNGLMGTMLE